MNLSKVYSTPESFTPEDIIRARLNDATPVFGGSLITATLPDDKPIRANVGMVADQDQNPSAAKAATDQKEQRQRQTPPPEVPVKQVEDPVMPAQQTSAPPPSPPGISPQEHNRLVKEAYENGLAQGQQQAEQDYGAATSALLLVCQQLDTLRETILRNSIGEMQDLALAIAEKIIRRSVEEQSATIVETIEEAIHKAVKSEEFTIYLNPNDYAAVNSKSEEMVGTINGLTNIVVKMDKSVERGGCRLESDYCSVDATISGQLEIIRDQIKQG